MNKDNDLPPRGDAFANLLETDGFNAMMRGRYGYYVFNRNDNHVGRSLAAYGEYSQYEVELFRQICRPGDHVVEVGANMGAHTLPLARMVRPRGRVVAFEPQQILFQVLCANLAINSIPNVEVFPSAVGAEAGHVTIPSIRYDLDGNFGSISMEKYSEGRKTSLVTLDDVVDLPKLRFLKVDVEGMERKVIEGARRTISRHRPIMYIENDQPEKSPALIGTIQELDYRLYWHVPRMFHPDNFYQNPQNIFPNIAAFNMLCVPREESFDIVDAHEITEPEVHPKDSH